MFFWIFLYFLFWETHKPRFKYHGKVDVNTLFFKVSHLESNGYGIVIILHIYAISFCPESSCEWVVQLSQDNTSHNEALCINFEDYRGPKLTNPIMTKSIFKETISWSS